MLSFGSKLRRRPFIPPAISTSAPTAAETTKHYAEPTLSPKRASTQSNYSTASLSLYSPSLTNTDLADALWYTSPVFDATYWYRHGGIDKVRQTHSLVHTTAEALLVSTSADEDLGWVYQCLLLGWPSVTVIDVVYNNRNVESSNDTRQWLRTVLDLKLFPQANMYRLTTHWSGCTEVFEHPLQGTLDSSLLQRLALLDRLPSHIAGSSHEMHFYRYRALFLVGVSFEMGYMETSGPLSRFLYTYIAYLLKTDIFSPQSIQFTDAQPRHMQGILHAIDVNSYKLTYDQLRVAHDIVNNSNNISFNNTLKRLRLDMHNMVDSQFSIPFSAAQFPVLESLVLTHSPDFKGTRNGTPIMDLGDLFRHPWQHLVELQLPFISDSYASQLYGNCPGLRILYICPESRYERWPEYSQPFTINGLYSLVSQWPTILRQLVVNYAFRCPVLHRNSATDVHPPESLTGTTTTQYRNPSALSRVSTARSRLSLGESSGNKSPLSPIMERKTAINREIPGFQYSDTFHASLHTSNLSVLRLPYLQLPFTACFDILAKAPHLSILEFAPVLKEAQQTARARISATLRRRSTILAPPSQTMSTPFSTPDTVTRLVKMNHLLEELILHGPCTSQYLSPGWIEVLNLLTRLSRVTFVATSHEDVNMADRVSKFCSRNNASFDVVAEDQCNAYHTRVDFAESWSKSSQLLEASRR